MFGTVEYFTDYLKAQVMHNFSAEQTISLSDCRLNLIEEIHIREDQAKEKKEYERNLEKAYKQVNVEIFGLGEKK